MVTAVPLPDVTLTNTLSDLDPIFLDQSDLSKSSLSRDINKKVTRINNVDGNTTNSEGRIAYTALTAVRTFTLQTADTVADREYFIYDESGAANSFNITITTQAAQKINGSTSNIAITANFGYVRLKCNGVDWFIIGGI